MTKNNPIHEQDKPSKEIYDYTQGVPFDGVERFFQLGSPLFNEIDLPDTTHPLIRTCGQILEFFEDYHAGAFLDDQLKVVFDKIGYHAHAGGECFVYGTYTTEEDGKTFNNFFVTAFNRSPERDNPDLEEITAHAWISGEIHTGYDDAGKERDYFAPSMILIPFVDPENPDLIELSHNELDPSKLHDVCHCMLFLESALQTFATGYDFHAFEIEKNSFAYSDPQKFIWEYLKKSTDRTYISLDEEIRDLKEGLNLMYETTPHVFSEPEEGDKNTPSDLSAATDFSTAANSESGSLHIEPAIPQENLFGLFQMDNSDFFHLTENADINAEVFDIIQGMLDMAECPAASDLNSDAPVANISLHFKKNDMNAIAAFVDYDFQGPNGKERRGILVAGQEETFLSNGEKVTGYRPYCVVAGYFYQPEGETTILFQAPNIHIRFNRKPHTYGVNDSIVFLDGPDHLMNGLCYADEAIQFIERGCRLDTLVHTKWADAPDELIGQAFANVCGRTIDEYEQQINRDADSVYEEELGKGADYRFFYPYPTIKM
ncbi:MAG: hypothetical protein RBR86_09060 [Pseudobdellovibrionaceae bacterium]|jgi:hypothetical protein|nr:hypothetical protein [Pseudobdellovibrionaceae bacterium]